MNKTAIFHKLLSILILLTLVLAYTCGNNNFPYFFFHFQFLSAPFHTETFPMVPFCVALQMLRASRCNAVSCSVTKVMSTPFLSPASCVIPRRQTGLMMLHFLTPAKVKATHTLFYLPVKMLTGCCNISFWDLPFCEVLLR